MSNELNVTELASGVLDPGFEVEMYFWGDNKSFNRKRHKARFFSVTPDPVIPWEGVGTIEFWPSVLNFEITRAWNTVWVSATGDRVFQTNVAIKNLGPNTGAFHLIQAETDN